MGELRHQLWFFTGGFSQLAPAGARPKTQGELHRLALRFRGIVLQRSSFGKVPTSPDAMEALRWPGVRFRSSTGKKGIRKVQLFIRMLGNHLQGCLGNRLQVFHSCSVSTVEAGTLSTKLGGGCLRRVRSSDSESQVSTAPPGSTLHDLS